MEKLPISAFRRFPVSGSFFNSAVSIYLSVIYELKGSRDERCYSIRPSRLHKSGERRPHGNPEGSTDISIS